MARLKKVCTPSVTNVFNSTKMSKAELVNHLTELGNSANPEQRRKALKKICTDFGYTESQIATLDKKTDFEVQTLGNVCILISKGHDLSDLYQQDQLKSKLDSLVGTGVEVLKEPVEIQKPEVNPVLKLNKNKSISNSLTEWLNSLDTLLDDFIRDTTKSQLAIPSVPSLDKVDIKYLKDTEVPQWKIELARLSEDDLEAYSNFSKRRLAGLKKYYIELIQAIDIEVQLKPKPSRTPRKPTRAKPVEKQLEKLSYNEEQSKVKKKDILGATELWGYNEKYHELIHWVAEEGKKFEVKGNTLQNIDTTKSELKKIRTNKIQSTLLEVSKANKNRCGLIFKAITAKEATPSPRLSSYIILIQAF